MTSPRKIALVGNPNCGKTTLFNALTGTNQRVGNWPGVTVDRKEGSYRHNGRQIAVVDLPGIYATDTSGEDDALDETIARNYLASGEAHLVVNIIDASNLERNLYLTTQLLEMGVPLAIALNMTDAAAERGVRIDVAQLSQRLGCPVVETVASRHQGIDDLRACIDRSLSALQRSTATVVYPAAIEDALSALAPAVAEQPMPTAFDRWNALKLLEYDDRHVPDLSPELLRQVAEQRHRIHQLLGEDIDIAVADSRYSYVHRLVGDVATSPRHASATRSDRIDRIVLDRWLGIPIFLGVMYLLFWFAINVGSAFIDFFDILFGTIFVEGFGRALAAIGTPDLLRVVLADGMGGGIQTVATFVPVIACLFLFLAFLEDSGYMARAAFVMDRFMRFIGLPGKSFVPMLVGFGCNVPAIMATRTLEHRRDRILTILMNPFMSCGARLPVYALFAAAFFPTAGQNVVFALYLIGMGMAVLTGLVMKHTLLKGEAAPFVLELPTYHMPTVKGVALRTWERLKAFTLRAGKVIVVMVMVLSLLNSVGTDGSTGNEDSDRSLLGAVGQSVTPVFAPMGIARDNWPATMGIFTGVFAKEAVVGTLDSLYTQLGVDEAAAAGVDLDAEAFDFFGSLGVALASIPANLAELPGTLLDPLGLSVGEVRDPELAAAEQEVAYTTFGQMNARFDGTAGAFAYLLFVLMYFPCAAAMGAVYRETNAGWTAFVGLWTTGLAYCSATLYYQIATWQQHPASTVAWVLGLSGVLVGTFWLLRFCAQPLKRVQSLEPR